MIKTKNYTDVNSLLDSIENIVVETDIVLDVGCGIVPMNYFRPKLHMMVEPWDEYAEVLRQRHADDKSVFILKLGAIEALGALHDKSVDSVFLLDVIEHLDKDVGFKVISEIERVTRRQAVIFTPLGFMPQHVEDGQPDAWGLAGGEMQEHKSGWLPEDFGERWEFHICETYHSKNFRDEPLEKVYGAFFAVLNVEREERAPLSPISDIRKPLPSEIALRKLQGEMTDISTRNQFLEEQARQVDAMRSEVEAMRSEVEAICGTFIYRVLRKIVKKTQRG